MENEKKRNRHKILVGLVLLGFLAVGLVSAAYMIWSNITTIYVGYHLELATQTSGDVVTLTATLTNNETGVPNALILFYVNNTDGSWNNFDNETTASNGMALSYYTFSGNGVYNFTSSYLVGP